MVAKKKSRGRRAHGEGSVFLRGDGRYAGQLSLGVSAEGKRLRRTVYGATEREVVDEMLRLRSAGAAGIDLRADRSTLAGYLTRWLELVDGTIHMSTHRSYTSRMAHVIREIGHIKVTDLETDDVTLALTRLHRTGGLSTGTLLNIRVVLGTALEGAVESGRIARNVALKARLPPGEPREATPLSEENTRTLVTALQTLKRDGRSGTCYGPFFLVMVTTGMRVSEVAGLTVGAFDLETAGLAVREQLAYFSDDEVAKLDAMGRKPAWFGRWVGPRTALCAVKSRAGKRDLVLLPGVVDMLRPLLEGRGESELAFVTKGGAPLDRRGVHRAWQRILGDLGLPMVRQHDARHAAGSMLIEQGVDNKVVAAMLGHSDPALTQRRYLHVRRKGMEQAAEAMGRALKPRES